MSTDELLNARQIPLMCSGHSRPVPYLCYSPVTVDGVFIMSACLDSKAMLRNADTGDWIGTFIGHKGAVWGASLDSKALVAATGSADFSAKLWNAASGDEIETFSHKHIVKSVSLSHDGKRLLTGGNEKLLRLFDVKNPSTPTLTFQGHVEPIKSVLWKDENTILSISAETELCVWDIRSGSQANSCKVSDSICGMELTWNEKYIIVSSGKQISLWSADRFELVKTIKVPFSVESASLHPDGKRIVAGGSDFYAHVIDFDTDAILETHKGHHGPIHSIRYHPLGSSYASGSEDGTVRIWQNDIALAIEKQKQEQIEQQQQSS